MSWPFLLLPENIANPMRLCVSSANHLSRNLMEGKFTGLIGIRWIWPNLEEWGLEA